MSKIFETLNRGGGELADLIRPVVGGPRVVPTNGAAKQIPTVPPTHDERNVVPEKPPTSADGTPWEAIRTLKLRVPAPSPLLPFESGQPKASEQYRILRTKITQNRRQPRVIVISSADAGDGKSVNAINTAAALSLKSEARSLLVDADLRRSATHVLLGLPPAPGLSDVLQGTATLEEALVHTHEFPNLYVLPAGTAPANPAELLDSAQWPALCARLRAMFRFVVIDSPPMGAVADYDLIQTVCDGIALVVRPDHTNRALLRKALESVPKEKLLGVMLNCVPAWSLSHQYDASHYYQYQDVSSAEGAEGRTKA